MAGDDLFSGAAAERLSARAAHQVLYRVGGRMPLHSTGVGLVLLAHAPAALQDEILGEDLTLYRGTNGRPHLVGHRCAHRSSRYESNPEWSRFSFLTRFAQK